MSRAQISSTGHKKQKLLRLFSKETGYFIAVSKNEGDPRGMLIDLDLAKELDSGPSEARHTGTMEFMTIEFLEGKANTYRHDLEFFFLHLSVVDYPLRP